MFRLGFHYLQLETAPTLAIKSALNMLSLYKWKKVTFLLIESRVRRQRQDLLRSTLGREQHNFMLAEHARKYRVLTGLVGMLFIGAATAFGIYTVGAVVHTQHACSAHPECIVPSYVWRSGDEQQCECVVLVDANKIPRTYAEWLSPPDVTGKIATLAASGRLRILELINRGVLSLPDALRKCRDLEQM